VHGNLFKCDPTSGNCAWLLDTFGNQLKGYAWSSTNKGEHVFISNDLNGLISSQVSLWNDATSQYIGSTGLGSSTNQTQWIVEAAANEDGTVIAAGGSTSGILDENPEFVEF
jgi:hypothetical protein